MSRVDKLHEAGDMDLGGVDVTAANDATVRGIEDERSIDSVEVAEWEELWPGAWEVSCCRDVATTRRGGCMITSAAGSLPSCLAGTTDRSCECVKVYLDGAVVVFSSQAWGGIPASIFRGSWKHLYRFLGFIRCKLSKIVCAKGCIH